MGPRGIWLCAFLLVSAPQSGGAEESGSGAMKGAAERMGIAIDRSAPMMIAADELDVRRAEDGGEIVIFRNKVSVRQADMHLRCDKLRAEYPEGTGEGAPQRITATGHVRIAQADSEARCGQAIFNEGDCKAICTSAKGDASLRRGENVIKGKEIIFDVCTGHLTVRGGARVHVKPEEDSP